MKELRLMTRAEILQRRRRLSEARSAVNQRMINAGRGYETPQQTREIARTDDPLARDWVVVADQCANVEAELARRIAWHGTHHRIIAPGEP